MWKAVVRRESRVEVRCEGARFSLGLSVWLGVVVVNEGVAV